MNSIRLVGQAIAGVLVIVMANGPAAAEDVIYTVNNQSVEDIAEMYTAPQGADDWQDNLLSEILPSGGNATVTIGDDLNTCIYNLRFVTVDGNELVEPNVNVCSLESYTIIDN